PRSSDMPEKVKSRDDKGKKEARAEGFLTRRDNKKRGRLSGVNREPNRPSIQQHAGCGDGIGSGWFTKEEEKGDRGKIAEQNTRRCRNVVKLYQSNKKKTKSQKKNKREKGKIWNK